MSRTAGLHESRRMRGVQMRYLREALPFLAIALVVLAVFRLWPMVENVRLSFTNSKGYGSYEYVGFDNYVAAFTDQKYLTALKNSLYLTVIAPIAVVLALVMAIFLKERPWGWRIFRFTLFLPAVLSPVVLGTYFGKIFQYDGPLNSFLSAIGLGSWRQDWLGGQSTALPSLIAVIVWAGLGVGVLIFLSALGSVDTSLYDAARVDGAGWLRQQMVVTIPALRPTISFYTVITVIGSFTATFPFVYVLTKGGPGYQTFVAEFAIYNSAFTEGKFGYAAAEGTVLFALTALILLILSRFVMRTPK